MPWTRPIPARTGWTARSVAYMDVMLPGMDGFAVLRALWQQGVSTPVLMLTARGGVQDRVQGLNLGADYLPAQAL